MVTPFSESLQGLTTLKIYSADGTLCENDEEAEKFRKVTMRVLITAVHQYHGFGGIRRCGTRYCTQPFEIKKRCSYTDGVFLYHYDFGRIFPAALYLGSFFHIAMNGNAAADKIFKLLDTKEPEEGSIIETEGQTICFENISFSYTPEKQVLKEVSFSTKERGITARSRYFRLWKKYNPHPC